MKVLCKPPSQDRHPTAETMSIKSALKAFDEHHYKAYVSEELSYRHMNTVLGYLSTDVITMYENNIKQNYVECVERYVNVSWCKKQEVSMIRESWRNTRSRQNALCVHLRRDKDDLLRPYQRKTSDPLYHAWIAEQRKLVLPARNLKKDNVHYDIQCSPQDYLPCMLRMMKAVKVHGTSVKNACPLEHAPEARGSSRQAGDPSEERKERDERRRGHRLRTLKDKTIVAIDPNMSDLLDCVRWRRHQGTDALHS